MATIIFLLIIVFLSYQLGKMEMRKELEQRLIYTYKKVLNGDIEL